MYERRSEGSDRHGANMSEKPTITLLLSHILLCDHIHIFLLTSGTPLLVQVRVRGK